MKKQQYIMYDTCRDCVYNCKKYVHKKLKSKAFLLCELYKKKKKGGKQNESQGRVFFNREWKLPV